MRHKKSITISIPLDDAHAMREMLNEHGLTITCKDDRERIDRNIELLLNALRKAGLHNQAVDAKLAEKKAAEDKLHQLFSMMRAARKRGDQRTVHFPAITQSSFTWEMESVNIFNSPTQAKFHWYEPRKRVVWLKFKPGDITNSLFDDDQYAFDLSEAVLLGFMSEETFKLKKEVV